MFSVRVLEQNEGNPVAFSTALNRPRRLPIAATFAVSVAALLRFP